MKGYNRLEQIMDFLKSHNLVTVDQLVAMEVAMLSDFALPVQAISNAVPWSAEVRINGSPAAMYHDQGHIPLKLLGFYDGVNITAGLPFIRTSAACRTSPHDTA
jgi:hypothetical protein